MLLARYAAADILDHPDLRELVLKAVAWGPPGETLATVAAKLLHGELLAYGFRGQLQGPAGDDPETREAVGESVLSNPLRVGLKERLPEGQAPLFRQPLVAHGIALLEFDPLGVVVNIAYLAAGRRVLGPFLDELAALAQRYGFQALECYSRRPGMGKLLTRHGWGETEAWNRLTPDGFRRFSLPLTT